MIVAGQRNPSLTVEPGVPETAFDQYDLVRYNFVDSTLHKAVKGETYPSVFIIGTRYVATEEVVILPLTPRDPGLVLSGSMMERIAASPWPVSGILFFE